VKQIFEIFILKFLSIWWSRQHCRLVITVKFGQSLEQLMLNSCPDLIAGPSQLVN